MLGEIVHCLRHLFQIEYHRQTATEKGEL
jgi:hypothetical protein